MALQRVGNKLVLEGARKFIADSERVNRAIENTNKKIVEQTKVATQSALPDSRSLQQKFTSLGKNLASLILAPFKFVARSIAATISGAVGLALSLVTAPAKLIGLVISSAIKAILLRLAAQTIVNALFGQRTFNLVGKMGNETAKTYATKFLKGIQPIMQQGLVEQFSKMLNLPGGRMGNAINKMADSFLNVGNRVKDAGDKAKDAAKKFGLVGTAINAIKGAFGAAKSGIGGIKEGFGSLPAPLKKAALAVGGVIAAIVAIKVVFPILKSFIGMIGRLGERGALVIGVAEAFASLEQQTRITTASMLNRLRVASAGMVSDFDLMKNANLALAGASGEVAYEIGQQLPKLLQIARAQAKATGQDVNFLFDSLVSGVKRGSPMLIDNTGLVLKMGEAYDQMAAKLGKSTAQLTESEKQIALLNATVVAGAPAIERLNNAQKTSVEINAKAAASFANARDKMAVAIQPLALMFAKVKLTIANIFLEIADTFAPLVQSIGNMVAKIFNYVSLVIKTYLAPLKLLWREIKTIVGLISIAFDVVAGVFQAFASAIQWVIGKISGAAKGTQKTLTNFLPFLKWLKGGLVMGTVRAFGAMAGAIAYVANKLIFPVVNRIAKFIADFLIGESPPPMGPLSNIDKGGANVMLAWLDGFASVSVEPVSRVAKEVVARMGPIANMSLEQVRSRLGALDTALQPFEDRLKLVKARLEAITAPLQAAKDIIEKRLNSAVKTLTESGGNAEQVRMMDRQLELINQRVSAAQEESALAELQLTLAKSQQSEERAALEIRERMLKASQQINQVASRTAAGAGSGASTAGGGGASDGGMGGVGDFVPPEIEGNKGTSIKDQIKAAFGEGVEGVLGESGLAEFEGNVEELQTQTGRIKQGIEGLPDRIAGAFTGLPGAIQEKLGPIGETLSNFFGADGPIQTTLSNAMGTLFTNEDSIFKRGLNAAKDFISDAFKPGVELAFNTLFGPLSNLAFNLITNFFALFSGEDSIFKRALRSMTTFVSDTFGLDLEGAFNKLFGEEGLITNAFSGVATTVYDTFISPINSLFTGLFGEEGTLMGIFSDAGNFGELLLNAVTGAVSGAFGGIVGAVSSIIAGALRGIREKLRDIERSRFIPDGLIPNSLLNALNLDDRWLVDAIGLTGAAKGALGLKGTFMTGEKGRELVTTNDPVTVFPNAITEAIVELNKRFRSPTFSRVIPVPPSASGTASTDNSINATIHNHHPTDSGRSIMMLKQRRAMGLL